MAVKNSAPITVAVSKLENRISVPAHQDASQPRTGATTFESRTVQEQGTH